MSASEQQHCPECPKCGSENTTAILYTKIPSYATSEWWQDMRERGVILGGDIIFKDSPAYACRDCGEQYGLWHERPDIVARHNRANSDGDNKG